MIRAKPTYSSGIKASKVGSTPTKRAHAKYTPIAANQRVVDICLECDKPSCKKGTCDKIRQATLESENRQ